MLPYINEVPKSRSYINEFRGYNHNLIISENEIYDGYNLTSDEYPVLSTRKPRGDVEVLSNESNESNVNILGMNGALGLAVVYLSGTSRMVFNFNGSNYFDVLDDDDTSPRQIVPFGTKLIIIPDWKVFDTIKLEFSSALWKKRVSTYDISYFINRGTEDEPDIELVSLGDKYDFFEDGKSGMGLYEKTTGTLIEHSGIRIGVPDDLLSFPGACISNLNVILEKLESWILRYGYPEVKYTLDDGYYIEDAYIIDRFYGGIRQDLCIIDGILDGAHDYSLVIDSIKPPIMDFVVECQNRLWGCRKGLNHDGEEVNEIYCTKLGTYDDWYTRDHLADSSYVASVGTPGNFTGAITLSQNPIFFKENVAHKVYVFSSGAHQVYTLDVRGVQEGSHGSLAIVNESVIYKGVRDVLGFDGTNVTPLSDSLGDVRYYNAVAGADGDKYVMYCEDKDGGKNIFTLDTRKGLWQRELIDSKVSAMASHNHKLLIGTENGMFIHEAAPGEANEGNVKYMLESGEIGFESPDAKTLCRLDFRVKLALGASFNVWIQYDSDGAWVEAVRYKGTLATPISETVYVLPRRCDHFKYKITGAGDMKLYSVSKVYERSET